MSQEWSVYILRCRGQRLYTGVSTDVMKRYHHHAQGTGAKFTRAYPPEALLAQKMCSSRSEALKLEYHIKQLSADAKLALVMSWQQAQTAKSDSNNPHMLASLAASSPQ